jgi:predicted ATPase
MHTIIKTPDQRLRVFVSSTLKELAAERAAVKEAILSLKLIPVMFEMGARPYPPRDLYTAYLQQSHIFIGVYWQQYGWVAPNMTISGLEDELQLSADMPRLIYVKEPAPDRAPELKRLINEIGQSGVSYKVFKTNEELQSLVTNDLVILFTERFESSFIDHQPALESDVLNEEFPIPPLPMIGRDEVVEAVIELIQKQKVHLLTITGTGGIGKTRLALEVLRKIKNSGGYQVCFVQLASIDQPENVPATILRKAFPAAKGSGSPLQLLIELFKNKKVLLVLDNFEHLIEARLAVSELLQHCPDLEVLVTSRELLHISGEYEYALQPLELSPVDIDWQEVKEIPASIELFLERTRSIHPKFEITEANFDVIRQICLLLDGIPLAIELAAARTRLLSPEKILHLLKENLDVLRSVNRDVPDRHQTLKATVDWSFDLLTPEEQRSICMLSVFSGGGTLEAASFIGAKHDFEGEVWPFPRKGFYIADAVDHVLPQELSEIDFLESAESLLSKSLMYTSVSNYGLLRINFYQTIKHYCLEKLRNSGLEHKAFRKHFLYYLYLAERMWSRLRSEEAEASYVTLDNDTYNIASALQWSVEHEPLLGLRLSIAMAEFWDTRGRSSETCDWIQKFLQLNSNVEKDHFEIFCVARVELARALFRVGEFEKAWDLASLFLAEARKREDIYFVTDALVIQSLINVYAHRNENKDQIIEEAISHARRMNYKMALLDCIQFKAADNIFNGPAIEGISIAQESLQLAAECKAKRWEAIAHNFLGFGHLNIGAFDQSKEHFINALLCTQYLRDQLLPVYSLLGLSQVALATQQVERACLLLGVIDTFLHKPGTSLVPIVSVIYSSTLAHLKTLQIEQLEELMNKGRKLRLSDGIQLVLQGSITKGVVSMS